MMNNWAKGFFACACFFFYIYALLMAAESSSANKILFVAIGFVLLSFILVILDRVLPRKS